MNWPLLIADLQKRGLSIVQIARLCGSSQSSLSDLKNQKSRQPVHSTGEALIRLHRSTDRQIARHLNALRQEESRLTLSH